MHDPYLETNKYAEALQSTGCPQLTSIAQQLRALDVQKRHNFAESLQKDDSLAAKIVGESILDLLMGDTVKISTRGYGKEPVSGKKKEENLAFAFKLRRFRQKMGEITMKQAAEMVGVAEPTWCRWENGYFQPQKSRIRKINEIIEEAGYVLEG